MGLVRIISGAQTGVDQGALLAANALGLETGGWAPLGWMTEDGPQEEFMRQMGLKECQRPGYPARTELNVKDADATLIFSRDLKLTGGSYQTLCVAESLEKLCCVVNPIENLCQFNDSRNEPFYEYDLTTQSGSKLPLRSWVGIMDIRILNVAGPRASKWPEGCQMVCEYLIDELGR